MSFLQSVKKRQDNTTKIREVLKGLTDVQFKAVGVYVATGNVGEMFPKSLEHCTPMSLSAAYIEFKRARSMQEMMLQARRADALFLKERVTVERKEKVTVVTGTDEVRIARGVVQDIGKKNYREELIARTSAIIEKKTTGYKVSVTDVDSELCVPNMRKAAVSIVAALNDSGTLIEDVIYDQDFANVQYIAKELAMCYQSACTIKQTPLGEIWYPTAMPRVDFSKFQVTEVMDYLRKVLVVFAGRRKGPGAYIAQHMDGVPLRPQYRRLFDFITDFEVTGTSVYYVKTNNPRLATALFQVLLANSVKSGKPVALLFDSTTHYDYRKLDKFVFENDAVVSVKESVCLGGASHPKFDIDVTYVDFDMPEMAKGNNLVMSIADARDMHVVKRDALEQRYRYVQFYISYMAMECASLIEDNMVMLKKRPEWDGDTGYKLSAIGRMGCLRYTNYGSEEKSRSLLNALGEQIYHSRLYMVCPAMGYKFGSFEVPLAPIYDISARGTKRFVHSLTMIDKAYQIDLFDADEYVGIKREMEKHEDAIVVPFQFVAPESTEQDGGPAFKPAEPSPTGSRKIVRVSRGRFSSLQKGGHNPVSGDVVSPLGLAGTSKTDARSNLSVAMNELDRKFDARKKKIVPEENDLVDV